MSDTKRRAYANNSNLRKFCRCSRRAWPTCPHAYSFNFKSHRGSLGVSDRIDALAAFATVKAAILNGTYVKPERAEPAAPAPVTNRPTFAQVAADYAERWIDRKQLSKSTRECHDGSQAFLATAMLPSGLSFAETPFHLLTWADVKRVIDLQREPRKELRTTKKGTKRMQSCGGPCAARALQNYLGGLWSWATDPRNGGYDVVSPFARAAGGRAAFEKPLEEHRERRLQEGEEERLKAAAGPRLRDLIVGALETGCRKSELDSLQRNQMRWLQNELYLPGGKTKSKKSRRIPISPALREILNRRLQGTTTGPNPQPFTLGPDHYVFGDEAGNRIKSISTAWENTVLRAHGFKPKRDSVTRQLTPECRTEFQRIDLHFHDLRHEAGSRKLEAGWPLHAIQRWLGHSKIDTTSKYLNADDKLLQELTERVPLTLVKR